MEQNTTLGDVIKDYRQKHSMSMDDFAKISGISKSYISLLEKNKHPKTHKPITPSIPLIKQVAKSIDMNFNLLFSMLDCDIDISEEYLYPPTLTEETVIFPVIGEVAAGYDQIAIEDWSGDTVEIPVSYLRGRKQDEYFVLSVKGDSMYPLYMHGDKVLILKQTVLERSGDIGVIIYEDCATIKKIEYTAGEDFLRMIPINPEYQPKVIEGVDLEQCKIIGIPRLLIREIGLNGVL